MTKVWEWNWKEEIVTEYEREGECNQCGICCTKTISLRQMHTPGDKRRKDHSSIWYEIFRQPKPRMFWRVTKIEEKQESNCRSFDKKTGKCKCNGDKQLICMDWPFSPEHQKFFPDCGYTFKKIKQRTFEEQKENNK